MAHLYLELGRTTRPFWPELDGKWAPLADALLRRDSVDIMVRAMSHAACAVEGPARGRATLRVEGERFSYLPETGDPLGVGEIQGATADEAYDRCASSDYPDGVVQIARLNAAARSGEIFLSAARNWDFRASYEPIPHLSSHGALHREHMLVPLLVSRPAARSPRRTVDVMPSALHALGVAVPQGLDGETFF
jgi:hypothetical protein